MAKKTEWIKNRIEDLGDDELKDLLDDITDKTAEKYNPKKTELIHISDMTDEIEEYYKNWGKMTGISTGYQSLDILTKGMNRGEVILIAGGTSTGKSALATNIACRVAQQGRGVFYITLEMLKEEIGSRFRYINNNRVDDLNVMFQLEHSIDYRDLDELIKNGVKYNAELIVIDYLQYLSRAMTLEDVAKMSKEIKRMALEYEVPIIVITQIRKGDRMRKWTDIEIDDIMGTSSIGYDCDIAMLTSRRDTDNAFKNDEFYVKILKNRNRGFDSESPYCTLGWDKTRIFEHSSEDIKRVNDVFGKST